MPYPWIKLYTESRHDPKLKRRCTPEERWIWIELLLMASESAADGLIQICDGVGYTSAELAEEIAVSEDAITSALDKFQQMNMVEIDDQGVIYLVHFADRQKRAPSSSPDRVKQRVAACRERQRNEAETSEQRDCNEDVTSMKRDSNAENRGVEEEVEEEGEGEGEADVPPPSSLFDEILDICEYSNSCITPYVAEKVRKAAEALAKARASPEDVLLFPSYWAAKDWRGKKGDAIEPRNIVEEWERFTSWQRKQQAVEQWEGWRR